MDDGLRLRYEGIKFSGTITELKKYLEEKLEKEETKKLMYEKCEFDANEDKL